MGGRSREIKREYDKIDTFAFVAELSNERLESYGQYTSASVSNVDTGGTFTQHGVYKNVEVFNERLVQEYAIRNAGALPTWDIQTNNAYQNRRAVYRSVEAKIEAEKTKK